MRIQPINDLSLCFSRLSEDPRLIEPMRQLMGDAPVLMEEKLNYKQPLPRRIGGLSKRWEEDRVVIHNDWAYYRSQGYPTSILSSTIAIDECSQRNGPLHVWPGSHREHIEHEPSPLGQQVKASFFDSEDQ